MGSRRVGCAAALTAALAFASPASAHIYWANQGGTTIARADNDGGNVHPTFVTNLTAPSGVAIDGTHIYWADGSGIGRANLGGSSPVSGLIGTGGTPQGVALDAGFVYWTNTVTGNGYVGRATLGGAGPNSKLVSTGSSPCGVAADGDKEFWANGGNPGSIGRAHGIFDPDQDFVTGASAPCGVAEAGGYVYWANRGGDSIGRVGLEGTDPKPDFIRTGAGSHPCGVAVDGAHVYWTSPGTDTIGRADLAGTNPDGQFITTGAQDPCGIAVSPTVRVTPATHAFTATTVGGHSGVLSLFVANTSSSVLDVSAIDFGGANPGDFELTGDGCTINPAPPGQGCVLNVRFSPRAKGTRQAVLQIGSNASDSPAAVWLTGFATAPRQGATDTTDPRILRSRATPRVFHRGRGTTFRYSLSETARVRFTLRRELPGVRIAGKCVRRGPRKVARARRCHRLRTVGGFTQLAFSGTNSRRFSGSIRHRRLRAGRYRARLVATDLAGNRSTPARIEFVIAPRRR